MSGRSRRKAVAFAVVAAVAAGIGLASATLADSKPDSRHLKITPISVEAKPITSFVRSGSDARDFGKLRFLGGLVLTSPGTKNFGGWSGLALDPDARGFVAVSDSGVWMTGSIAYSGDAPHGLEKVRIGPLLALDGKPLRRRRDRDAEAIAIESGRAGDGTILVAFERNSRLARYRMSDGRFSRTIKLLEKPAGAKRMRSNQGFEAMTVMKGGPFKGTPVAISERLFDGSGNHTGWIWTGRSPSPFHIRNIGDFDITDIASLDDGTLFVLERRFRWLEGVKMRVRRIDAEALKPGVTLDGEVLIEADLENEIDNMEGMDVTRAASGEVILTMISDDNFNPFLQRNLLLQFALARSEAQKTRPEG